MTVLVHTELLAEFDDWSPTVQVMIIRTPGSETGYELIARTVADSKEAVDRWVRDHAYAPDDIVLGDGVTSISDKWLDSLHALLDAARPGWRDLFREKP